MFHVAEGSSFPILLSAGAADVSEQIGSCFMLA